MIASWVMWKMPGYRRWLVLGSATEKVALKKKEKKKKKKKAGKGIHWQNVRLLEQGAAEGTNMGDRNSGSLGSPQSRGHLGRLSTETA